jgi:general secretion pathway protein E
VAELIKDRGNIMAVEDPIEYRVEGVNQIQVNRAAGIDFPAGLRSIMRLDPDIILVGEIKRCRDHPNGGQRCPYRAPGAGFHPQQ